MLICSGLHRPAQNRT